MTLGSRPRPGSINSTRRTRTVRKIATTSAVLFVAALGVMAGTASDASAGGWAVASIDAVPTPRAGTTEMVGFTILQHGVTPVDLLADPAVDPDTAVGIELADADGSIEFFPAVPDGGDGHYVAEVVFDDAGDHEWSIRMGWFGSQALGTVTVTGAGSSSDGSSWPTVRIALTVLAAILVAGAMVDLRSSLSPDPAVAVVSRTGRGALLVAAVLVVFVVATWGRDDQRAAATTADGASLFRAKGCATCHLGPDTEAVFDGYPPLDDAPSWAADRRPGMSATDYLSESMAAPDAFSSPAFTGGSGPSNAMPRLRLTSEEIDALIAYLLGE